MQIYSSTLKGPLKVTGFIDPDDQTIIQTFWGAPTFTANTVYRLGNITKPTNDNGYYYECTLSGKSGAVEPTWQLEDDTIVGTAIFKPISYDLFIMPGEYITNSLWNVPQVMINDLWVSNSGHVILANSDYGLVSTTTIITTIDPTVQEFDLTNQVTKTNGEKLSRTFRYKTNQQ